MVDDAMTAPVQPTPASWDTKALETAYKINLMWGHDRSQFISKIQNAVLDAMRWAAPVQPTEPLTFEAWWDSDPERKRFHPMSIARMAWQAASAQAPVQPTEPDAWLVYVEKHDISYVVLDTDDADLVDDCTNHGGVVTPLYAHPPLQPTEQTIEQRNRAVCALYDHPPAQPEELERLRGIIRTLWTNQDPYEWQDDFVAEVNAAIAAPPVQPMEPVAWFWFDPEDGGEWKHVADNAEDAAAYGTQAVPLCRCAHPPVQPTEPK